MYHNKKGRRLGRRPDHRVALIRNMAISLIEAERIETTVPRAKELRRFVERLVTYAKRGELHGRRLIISRLGNNPEAAAKLIDEIAPRYEKRAGGYTRVLKTGFRRGDAASTALIEWVEEELPKRKKKKAPRKKAAAAAVSDEAVKEEDPIVESEPVAETSPTEVAEAADNAENDDTEKSS